MGPVPYTLGGWHVRVPGAVVTYAAAVGEGSRAAGNLTLPRAAGRPRRDMAAQPQGPFAAGPLGIPDGAVPGRMRAAEALPGPPPRKARPAMRQAAGVPPGPAIRPIPAPSGFATGRPPWPGPPACRPSPPDPGAKLFLESAVPARAGNG